MNDNLRADVSGRLAAVTRARAAFETVLRLGAMMHNGKTLTANQLDDHRSAQVHYNDDARDLGLPELRSTDDWTDEDYDKVAATLYGKHSLYVKALDQLDKMDRVQEQNRDRFAGIFEDSPRRAPDEIRQMLAGGERQHDFDFLETDAIRSLPSVDGDEMRTITNFANGTALSVNDFASYVAVYARTMSPWLGLASVVTSDNGRPLVVPKLTGDPTVYTPGEGTAITASDVTLSTVTVTPAGYKALMYIAAEAFEDEDVNLTQVIARAQARALSLAFGSAATTAVLAGINNGGTATAIGGYGTAAGTFLGYEDLVDLQYGRAAEYRASGSWVMANGSIKKAKKWRDGQGNYMWPSGPLPTGGLVYEDPYLADPGSATKSVIYGDTTAGLVIKASPLRVAISTDYKFNEDVVAIKTVHRIALAVQDPAALAYLVSADS